MGQLVAAYCWLRPQWSPPASWSQSSPLHHLVPVTGSGSWFLIFCWKILPIFDQNPRKLWTRAHCSSPAPAEKLGWSHISSLCRHLARPHCQHWGGTRQGDPGLLHIFQQIESVLSVMDWFPSWDLMLSGETAHKITHYRTFQAQKYLLDKCCFNITGELYHIWELFLFVNIR